MFYVKHFGIPAIMGIFLVSLIPSVHAEIPEYVNYQGKVTNSSGTPVPDGTYDMRFRIFDAETVGNLEWNSGILSIQVTDGIFNVLLGESPQPALSLGFDESYWLEVFFDGSIQSPRQPLTSAGYAYMSSGLVPGTHISGDIGAPYFTVLKVSNTATTGNADGINAVTSSSTGKALYGEATAEFGHNYGVYGKSSSIMGRGVQGLADATSGSTCGVFGGSSSTDGVGVMGYVGAASGVTSGGWFECDSPEGRGVYAMATASTGTTNGVSGMSSSTQGRGVYGYAGASSGITYGGRFVSESYEGRGIYGKAMSTFGTTYGVYGVNDSNSGTGVYGIATASSGTTYGLYGVSDSPSGTGVYGRASSTGGSTYGVYGSSSSTSGKGVCGIATAPDGHTYGVHGESASTGQPIGIYGKATATSVDTGSYGGYFKSECESGGFISGVLGSIQEGSGGYGVYGAITNGNGYGGGFFGDIIVMGDVEKNNCYFLIDHPLDPENKLLRHSCVESPENLLMYRGRVILDANGTGTAALPDYFTALADERGSSVHLTPRGQPFPTGYDWNSSGDLLIIFGEAGREVSWMVLAERDDPVARHRARPVEEDKGPDSRYCDRGIFLFPVAYGYPIERAKDYRYLKITGKE